MVIKLVREWENDHVVNTFVGTAPCVTTVKLVIMAVLILGKKLERVWKKKDGFLAINLW